MTDNKINGSRVKLGVNIGRLFLKNPVMTASGTFGYGEEYAQFFDLGCLGAIVVKGLSLKPKSGNPPPRIVETHSGMLNAIGLANVGVETFIREKLPVLRKYDTRIIANIYGHHIDEYGDVAYMLKGVEGISALEVNISCPNVECGGMVFGVDPDVSARVTERVLKNTDKPVIMKLTPNVTDIRVIARAVESAGAHAISLINTLTGMAIDVDSRTPKLANIYGGLSGPAIRPVAVFMVYQAASSVRIPVIGMGGIMDARDALEFIIAGASAVQVGTANFVNPAATLDVLDGIKKYCEKHGIGRIEEIVGSLKTQTKNISPAETLRR